MKTNSIQVRPFGWRDKVGYMVGNIANDFTFIFASLYLTVFYTDVLGINAGLVGTMFLVARIIDAFTDTRCFYDPSCYLHVCYIFTLGKYLLYRN